MPASSPTVAIVDIGSNSIKLLVASRGDPVATVHSGIEETRISAGISGDPPRLQEDSMVRGIAGIERLIHRARSYGPDHLILAATSAVRDARNRADFEDRLRSATGMGLRLLSGEEEARYIALGAGCDPLLRGFAGYRLVDLGGGSLEVIRVAGETVQAANSYRLGAVRLTEQFVAFPENPVPANILQAVDRHVRETLQSGGHDLRNPFLPFVGAGGAFNVARAIWENSPDSHRRDPRLLPVRWLRQWRSHLAAMTLAERMDIPGVPPQRADIMPVAVQTMVSAADCAGCDAYHHTAYNLRYGLAREWLGV